MDNNQELLAKAKEAKNSEELLTLARENGIEMTDESAAAYFDIMHPKAGELADEELDNVSGGGCRKGDGRLIVSACYSCGYWECCNCGVRWSKVGPGSYKCGVCGKSSYCNNCYWCSYEKGLWLCNKN
mgnify:CR=1 FL=1